MLRAPLLAAFLATAGLAYGQGRPQNISPPEKPTGAVALASWNMRWFPSGKSTPSPAKEEAKTVDSAARFLRWWGADIVMLQEVRDAATCSNLVAQPALAGFQVNVCSSFRTPFKSGGAGLQTAVISRYPAVDAGTFGWNHRGAASPPRGVSWCVLDVENHLIAVATVHLKSNYIGYWVDDAEAERRLNTAKREESARQLVAFLGQNLEGKSYGDRRVETLIVGGDLNTSTFDADFAGEQTIPTLLAAGYKDVFADVPEKDRATTPETGSVFDWLFVKGPAKVSTPRVAPPQYTSDHQLISVFFTPPS